MAYYQVPQDYQFDPQTGLYYSQIIASDVSGNQSQIVTWFNADTGQYSQNVYPISPSQAQQSQAQYSPAQQSQAQYSSVKQSSAQQSFVQQPSMRQSSAQQSSMQRKRPAPPPINRSIVGASDNQSQKRREVTEELKSKGRALGNKGREAMSRAGEGIKVATAGIGAQMAENARMNAENEGLAYTAVDKDGNTVEPGFFRNIFYIVKRFINNAPWWLLLAIVGGCLVLDSIRALIWGFDVSNFLPLILFLLFPAIPCTIMHFRDMKNKYGVKFKETIPTIPLALCGMLSVFPAVCISFDLSLIALFEGPGPLGVILWYVCIALSTGIMYLVVKRRFNKYGLPFFELRITIVLLAFISVLAGIAALWAILIVMLVALVLFLIPMLLEAGSTPSTSTSSYTESHTEGYDQWGNKVYDSRYDGDFDTWANS